MRPFCPPPRALPPCCPQPHIKKKERMKKLVVRDQWGRTTHRLVQLMWPCICNLVLSRQPCHSRLMRPNDTQVGAADSSWTPIRPWTTLMLTSIYTITIMQGELGAKIQDDNHSSRIRVQVNFAKVINQEFFEAPETRRPRRLSRIRPTLWSAQIYNGTGICIF